MDPSELEKEEEGFSYQNMLRRDRRRWSVADQDGDDALTKEEFSGFLHPEETGHMRDIVVLETMEDIDKDKDGRISLNEYIGDMYRGTEGEPEPDWVKNEREQFSQYRDKDGDGFMDKEEVSLQEFNKSRKLYFSLEYTFSKLVFCNFAPLVGHDVFNLFLWFILRCCQ